VGISAAQKERWAEIIRLYQAGELLDDIATRVGIDRKTVYNVARRAGLPRRYTIDLDRRARILDAYAEGTPVTEITRSEGVARGYVRQLARGAGLPPRKGWQRRYPLDEHVFDKPDAIGWWLIGLLAADGSIGRESNLISLTQRRSDADVLRAFLAYVGCPERPLTELKLSPGAARRAWPRSPACEARVWSRHMQNALARHGLTTTKTRDLRFSPEAAGQPAVWLGLLEAFWGARLTFQRGSRPAVNKHRAGLARVALFGKNASSAARILLKSSPVSLQRKRRILEAIASAKDERSH